MLHRPSVFGWLVGMVDRPGATLSAVVADSRWHWLAPAGLTVISLGVFVASAAPHLWLQAQQVMAAQLARLPVEQARLVQEQMAPFQTQEVIVGSTLITGLLSLAIGWLLQATVLYLGTLIVGGEFEFRRLLAAVPWLSLPFVLENFLQAAYVRINDRLIINQGLSYLFSAGDPLADARSLAYVAASQVTLFRLWHWVLVYALLRTATRLSRGTALLLATVYAALGIVFPMALAALSAMLQPSF